MKIDLDWIQKELDAGNTVELECVDEKGLLKDIDRSEANEKILDQGPLKVDYIDYDGDIILGENIGDLYFNVIVSEEFKYFRIKRPAPTFDDFIDIAVQAQKDKLINHLKIDNVDHYLGFEKSCGTISAWDYQCLGRGIQYINSLYTETFVIECDGDIERLRDGAKITLTNNEKGVFNIISGLRSITNTETGAEIMGLNTFWLKGATVTQKRGK